MRNILFLCDTNHKCFLLCRCAAQGSPTHQDIDFIRRAFWGAVIILVIIVSCVGCTSKADASTYAHTHTYTHTHTDTMLAQLIYGEARGCSTTEQAAVVWNVLNRVDSPEFPDTIEGVVLQRNAYAGYKPHYPVKDEFVVLSRDVLTRWEREKTLGGDQGRVLPKEYVFFHGDGRVNWFRTEFRHTGAYWSWQLESPYE